MRLVVLCFVLLMVMACSENETVQTPNYAFSENHDGLTLPENFGLTVFVDSLGRGRHLAVRDNGDVFVHLRRANEAGQAIIALRDIDGDGIADEQTGFSDITGSGIEVHNDHLYYANTTDIYRVPFNGDELLPINAPEHLVNMVEGQGHMEKSFAFDGNGNMLVNIGSMSNACQEKTRSKESIGIDPCIELETRAGIWKFSDSETDQEQSLDKRYATGIRNALAISWNASANSLYGLSHGRDDLHRFWPELFTEDENVELPAEEFFRIEENDDFGWPYCYYNQKTSEKLLNPEYGGDGTKIERCADAKNPIIGFPGHWAPNDVVFYTGNQFPEKYHNGAFIAFHGSWNRLGANQDGFRVVFVPMDASGQVAGDWEVFVDGFLGSEPIESPGLANYRPCGLAQAPDGTLLIVDSVKGRVWKVIYQA